MRARVLLGVIAMLGVVVVGCDDRVGGPPEVGDARVGAPTGPNAALYFNAQGNEADRLVGARSSVASEIKIHESTTGDDETTGMRAVDGLDLRTDESLVLEPGGYHLMLIDVERLQVGDEIDVTLVWENAGEWTISARVVEPGDTMSHG